MVHENAPHGASGNRQKMRPVLPRDIFGIDQPQVDLIDERRRLKAVPGTLSCHAPSRDLVELPLYERNQLVEGGRVPLTPFQEQCGGLRGMVRNVFILCLLPSAPFRGPFPLYRQEVAMGLYRGFTAGIALAGVIGLMGVISGCSHSSGLPGSPSTVIPEPPPAPSGPAPAVADVLPSVGSAAGGATIKIVGTGFMPGMTAMFDGIKVTGRFDSRDTSFTTFLSETPAHAAGTVDLTVTNPDGQSHRVAAGYSYAPQESFDPNGVWGGFSLNGTDTLVEFVIEANRLVSASCWYDAHLSVTFAESPSLHSGEFSAIGESGATISGRIVSATEMVGTISFPPCTTTPLPWRASRQSD